MSDAIGAMRHRVMVQKPTRVADEIGGAAISWADDGACWAEIEATGAGESPAFDAARSVSSFRVSIYRRDIAAGWRLMWGERCLRIIGVRDDAEPRLTLSCE